MIKVRCEIAIERTPAEVFGYLSDLSRLPEWQKGVIRSRVVTPGPVGVGTRFEETAKVGPWRLESQCAIVRFDPPRAMGFTAQGKQIDYEGAFTLEPDGAGTRLVVEGTARLKGAWRLMQPLLAGDLKRETRGELAAIKARVEAAEGLAPATA